MEIENKIKRVLYRTVGEKARSNPRPRLQLALNEVINSQFQQGRIDQEGIVRLRDYVQILLDEHYVEDLEDEDEDSSDE